MSALCLSQTRAHFPSRRGDGQLKLQMAVFTPSSPQGSWRPWTHTMTTPKPLPHSPSATAPSRPCSGDSCSLPAAAGAAASWQSRDMAASAAAKTHSAAASACPGEMGYGSQGSAQGSDHHPTDSSNMTLQHPWQPAPRRNHLSAIF